MMEKAKFEAKNDCLISSSSSSSMIDDVVQEVKELLPTLPKAMEGTFLELASYQGFWYPTGLSQFQALLSFQRCFQSRDTDIIVASNPKSGTTWLKAAIFSIVNRTHYTPLNSPLLSTNPHDLVPFPESLQFNTKDILDLSSIPSPRLLSSHLPHPALPESIKQSNCLIVYICRNPFDSAISLWHHYRVILTDFEMPIEDFVEVYFKGISFGGPYWDHVLGYWKASLEKPNKVLFLKYEDLKEDIVFCLKRLAEFIEYPFTQEEDGNGVIEEIAELCSLRKLKNLEVNIEGMFQGKHPNKGFFRKGEVGGWVDYISPSKKQHLENVMQEKLRGSGLSFRLSI